MIDDEPAFWALLPARKRAQVEAAARGMCRSREPAEDGDEDHERHGPCTCDHDGGSCVAFGLWGDLAFAAIEALDALDREARTPAGG